MKTEITQEAILQTINNQRQFRYDQYVDQAALQSIVNEQGSLLFNRITKTNEDPAQFSSTKIHFSDLARQQILTKIKVPADFFGRCPSDIQHEIFEHFNNLEKRIYLLRMDPGCDIGAAFEADPFFSERVRAVLSDGYSVIDNHVLFPQIFASINKGNTDFIKYTVFEGDDKITRLVLNFTDCTGEYNGNTYVAGLSVTNSEVGQSSVWIEPIVQMSGFTFYHRSSLQKQGLDCRVVHRGNQAFDRVDQMIAKSKEVAQVGLVQLLESWHQTVNKDHALRYVKSIDALPSRFHVMIEDDWKQQEELSRAAIAFKILEVAKELPLFQRTIVEQQAGGIIGLFNDYETRMSAILEEIE